MGKSETTDGSSGVRQRIAPLVTVERGIRQLSDADTVQDYEYEFLRGSVRLRYVNPSPRGSLDYTAGEGQSLNPSDDSQE